MTIKFSTGLRNALAGTVGFKGAFTNGHINIYSGPQPLTGDTGATGTLLGTVSVDGTGGGLHFENPADGTVAKSITENWKFTGLANGTAGWFRMYPAAGDPSAFSTTEARMDGSIASSGGDATLAGGVTITLNAPSTMDAFFLTIPAQ